MLYFPSSSKGAVSKIKHSYEEYVINLLLFLFHSKFQKVKIAFLHNSIYSQHNDRLNDVMQLTLECVNNNEDTKPAMRFNLKFTVSAHSSICIV